jgi:DNA-binding response OmpR family regulator
MKLNLTAKPNPPQPPPRAAPFPPARPPAVKPKILVVDDDPQIRESLHKVLCAEGYDVVLAANGREGIEKFQTGRTGLLLLDVSLPDMSGWDVFAAVTLLDPVLPILIVTGRNDQDQVVMLSGVGALIEKPLDVPRLLQTIADMLAEPAETHLIRLLGLNHRIHEVRARRVPIPAK